MLHPDVSITFNDSLFRSENLASHAISGQELAVANSTHRPVYQMISSQLQEKQLEFANLAETEEWISLCQKAWDTYSLWARRVVIVGIGGADQSAKMIYNAFGRRQETTPRIEFLGSFIDPDEVARIKSFISGHETETVIVVMSKSGTTVEAGAGYLTLRGFMQKVLGDNWKKHFLFVTDRKNGLFIREVETEGLPFIPTSAVGDRFAPLSALGILPAIICQADPRKMLSGAATFFRYLSTLPQEKNIAWTIALYQKLFQEKYGISITVLFTYISRLAEFNLWVRQLFAESLGKEGKGIMLDPALGPRDQHSTLQMYNDGPWRSSFIFLTQHTFDNDTVLPNFGVKEISHLRGKSLWYITEHSARNTMLTLKNFSRPSAWLSINSLNAETFGALVALFEMTVIYLGHMFGLKNVFDQPGVTQSRELIDASMNRQGSETAQKYISDAESAIVPSKLIYEQ